MRHPSPTQRYIFITGGVVSSLGKGLASAALGALLQARGYSVRLKKLDPYLNVDPGTMSPYQHGEVFVTDDGAETDLDLGHYERFTGVPAKKSDNITTGRIYQEILAKEAGAKDTDVDLGLVPKSALIDKKIAEAAFALEKDKISDVIEGTFATVLVRVTQIEPGIVRTLADVKDQVRDKIATERARDQLQDKHDEIDEARNAGKTLKELGDETKLVYKEVAAADSRGLDPNGLGVLPQVYLQKVTSAVFSPDSGIDQQSIELSDGGYAWINVLSTEAPKQKPFEDVKDCLLYTSRCV